MPSIFINRVDQHKSINWLTTFAEEVADISYEELIRGLKEYVKTGDKIHFQGFSTPDECYSQRHEIWQHFAAVTGITPDDLDDVPFSCGC